MGKIKQSKGITLIALVITIIVLLILAGITINLTIGQDGILKRAQEAGRNYTNAADYEREQLAQLNNEVDNIINGIGGNKEPTILALGTIIRTENNINYTADGIGNVIPVPVGFSAITTEDQGTLETGFVMKDVTTNKDGTPTETNGNEFVWVPVDDTTPYSYERVAFSRTGWKCTQTKGDYDETSQSYKIIRADTAGYNYTETMPSIGVNRTELDSVTEYGGFYIGRYEVGVIGTLDTSVMINSTTAPSENWTGYTNGTPLVQKDKKVWNYVTRDKAKKIAEGMYSNLENVTSRLCSSYAWDTALKFIETQNSAYLTKSEGGNYNTSSGGTGQLQNTGYDTTHPCNIYDMGGNVWEWTTEASSNVSYPCTRRGGNYNDSASDHPAANRNADSTTYTSSTIGFRSTLYL